MPNVPIDGRPQYPKLAVEIVNAMNGREPTAGVHQQVGDSYILEKYPPAPKASRFGGPSMAVAEPETPKSPAQALWPHLK
jgi:hypothetical protein